MLVERGTGNGKRRRRATWASLGFVVVLVGLLGWGLARTSRGPGAFPHRFEPKAGRVVKVLDGDTIVVAGIGTVRYLGIDTPELHHPRKPVQRFAGRARIANHGLVAGSIVRLVTDVETHDKYGRLLAYVYRGSAMVNVELVRRGLARAYPFAPNLRHAPRFAALEREARRQHRGMWGDREGGPPTGTLVELASDQ
jgi:micrococcal nuclease